MNLSAPLRGGKNSLLEGGHRVAFIASFQGVIKPGSTSDATVMGMDLLPTFAKLANAPIPAKHQLDGIDIMPLLKGGRLERERDLHWLAGNQWAVRRGDWKLSGSRNKPTMLVNLANDIAEEKNLLSAAPEQANGLLQAHQAWAKSLIPPP
jgi:arylsulfatase A-like enzyme